jgi:hypothetical protein
MRAMSSSLSAKRDTSPPSRIIAASWDSRVRVLRSKNADISSRPGEGPGEPAH